MRWRAWASYLFAHTCACGVCILAYWCLRGYACNCVCGVLVRVGLCARCCSFTHFRWGACVLTWGVHVLLCAWSCACACTHVCALNNHKFVAGEKKAEGKHLDFQEAYKEFRQQASVDTCDSLPSMRQAFQSRCTKRKQEDEEDLLPEYGCVKKNYRINT